MFYDSEFTTLNPYEGELLSVGMVKINGEEFYVEIEVTGHVSEWVKEHNLPLMKGEYVSCEEARKKITEFLGKKRPHFVCFVPHYDIVYLHKLFGMGDEVQDSMPYHKKPIDVASILFAQGVDPEYYSGFNEKFFSALGVDIKKYSQHNALDDAKLLREVYLAMVKNEG